MTTPEARVFAWRPPVVITPDAAGRWSRTPVARRLLGANDRRNIHQARHRSTRPGDECAQQPTFPLEDASIDELLPISSIGLDLDVVYAFSTHELQPGGHGRRMVLGPVFRDNPAATARRSGRGVLR